MRAREGICVKNAETRMNGWFRLEHHAYGVGITTPMVLMICQKYVVFMVKNTETRINSHFHS